VSKLIVFNKPFQVLSQFKDAEGRSTLAEFIKIKRVYAAGRLDYDSEGLMLLTDDGRLQSLISHPRHKLEKTYWVQVEGVANHSHCEALMAGVDLKDGPASAINCKAISCAPKVWRRDPPIRVRKTVADSWIELTINEGRNRQVRRMTAAVGLPTLRLIRAQIGNLRLGDLLPGELKVIHSDDAMQTFKKLLKGKS